ncbi:MAG TPA: hypothetical protein P5121_15775, partial [Caldilineaceae bacterium]|nr:hypothetical protein [Caldilineaceae bacterium]
MNIALDVMGGDHAPGAIVAGAVEAARLYGVTVALVGKPEIIRQVEDDRRALEELVGYEIVGMAYPCGGVNNNDYVASVIAGNTPIKYVRTITCNESFERQSNLYRFQPTVYHMDFDKMFELAREFVEGEWPDDRIFYVWGHSYEFDYHDTWGKFEEFCQ